jgi:Lipopolysaccharide export system permease LptF/LptG
MTANHPLRRLLARVCSPETMSRVVDPTLADLRWETGRPVWVGYSALARALTLHALTSTPGAIERVCSDDDHAVPKVAAYATVGATLASAVLGIAPYLKELAHDPRPFALAAMLVPHALVLTLPAALLIAVPLALRSQPPSARIARRIVVLSICWTAITLGVLAWILPEANQAFRVRISGQQNLGRGLNETGFPAMRREIERLRTFDGGEPAVRRLEYEYQMRLALAGAAVPLALLALSVSGLGVGRRRPALLGIASVGFYALVIFPFMFYLQSSVSRNPAVPPFLLAWLPNLSIVLASGLLFLIHRRPLSPRLPPPRPPASLAA